jgi:hypothetical protein
MRRTSHWTSATLALLGALAASPGQAATITIQGTLGFVNDAGGGVYSGSGVGTPFSGFIDDVTFSGQISDGVTLTVFGCCIAAGGMDLRNDAAIDDGSAQVLNLLTGTSAFAAGQIYDGVDLEGDVATAGGGRIEVGVSYILDAGAFADEASSNYPFDPADVRAAVFFIFEEDASSEALFEGFGLLQAVPEPAPTGMACCAVLALAALRAFRIRFTS